MSHTYTIHTNKGVYATVYSAQATKEIIAMLEAQNIVAWYNIASMPL
jgi:hypothetical protein